MEKWIGLSLIVFPAMDLMYRHSRGASFRKLKQNQDIAFVKRIVKQTSKFYEVQWWHRVSIGAGIVIVAGLYI